MSKILHTHIQVFGVVLVSFVFMLLSGCATKEQQMIDDGYKPLTTQELNELFSKPVNLRWTLRDMEQGNVELSPDKAATITHAGGVDYGTWAAEDDRLCISWDRFRGGGEECNTLFKIEKNKFKVVPPDKLDFTVIIE